MDEIGKKYDLIKDQLDAASEKVISRNRDALNIKPNLLKDLKADYEELRKALKNRLGHFSKSGAGYSRLVGYGTAVAAGWFFSGFALGKELNNQDVPFFLF